MALRGVPETGVIGARLETDMSQDSDSSSLKGGLNPKEVDKQRAQFANQMQSLDDQMGEAKDFLRTLNGNMGVRSGVMYRVANFMFLMVIFGIEFDMTGLICSVMTYWSYDIFLLKFLLGFFCFAFVMPLVVHYAFLYNGSSGSASQPTAQAKRQPITAKTGYNRREAQKAKKEFVGYLQSSIKPRNPFGGEIQFYHFVPAFRFYLLLKSDTDMTDVDAIFRINTLSSFTFGFYQIVGILFTFLYDYEANLFVWANIGSQVINWSITVIYFVTPIASWMGRAQEARTVSRFYQGLMNEWSNRYCREDAGIFDVGNDDELAQDKKEKQELKARLANRLVTAFAGKKEGKGKHGGKDISQFGLEKMRDLDVKAFIEIMRDQAICTLEMTGTH